MNEKNMRPLEEDEKRIISKRLEENKHELESIMFALHQAELMINEGIDVQVYEQRKSYKKQLSAINAKISELTFVMETSETQLKDGVEVKEKAKETHLPFSVDIPIEHLETIKDELEEKGCMVYPIPGKKEE